MADQETPVDENGVEVKSGAAKWMAPLPAPEDLVRVRTGPENTDYVYVDPASLFALERLMASQSAGRYVKGIAKGYKKFVRDVAEKAYVYWPEGGYISVHPYGFGNTMAPLAGAAPVSPVNDPAQMGLFEAAMGPESSAWADAVPPEPDLVDDGEEHSEDEAEMAEPVLVPITPAQ